VWRGFYVLQEVFLRKSGESLASPFYYGLVHFKLIAHDSPHLKPILETAEVVAYSPNCREQSELGKPYGFYLFLLLLGIDESTRKKQNLKLLGVAIEDHLPLSDPKV
jgi:hypothetical protein